MFGVAPHDGVRRLTSPRLDLAALAARLPPSPLTRFAPSPTGYLHLGHVSNALYVWGLARALGGRVLLRIEDHDRTRSRPEYEAALLDDLDWLGLTPDIGPTAEFRAGPSPYRQSDADADAVYAESLAQLEAAGLTYHCECSRKTIARAVGQIAHQETRYPGRCRHRGLGATAAGTRVIMEPGEERFTDGRLGSQTQDPSTQCGDLLVRDRLGQWTYQFAVVVDDIRQSIDLVVRGEDLLSSTGRQIRLARLLGRATPPVFVHHPLIRKPSGEKLSKISGDTGIRELRAAGASPAMVLGEAAWRVGLVEAARPVTADDLVLY